mmetsp:Transcript_18763/g.28844  ORF Transcript_18763/g.28844 Transcript_18763/m.28844 type:complete len:109 (-) Transcript_18763:596-922(-)
MQFRQKNEDLDAASRDLGNESSINPSMDSQKHKKIEIKVLIDQEKRREAKSRTTAKAKAQSLAPIAPRLSPPQKTVISSRLLEPKSSIKKEQTFIDENSKRYGAPDIY